MPVVRNSLLIIITLHFSFYVVTMQTADLRLFEVRFLHLSIMPFGMQLIVACRITVARSFRPLGTMSGWQW